MNKDIIYNKVLGLAVAALAFAACADQWDDHYTSAPLEGANGGTLWQAIEQNDQLSNFKRVADSCGYAKYLDGSQTFTVFAPTNTNFSTTQADSVIALFKSEAAKGMRLSDNRAVKEFLKNHIARYTHSISSVSTDTIVMMNGKYMELDKSSFGGKNLLSSNQVYDNGVLFTIDEPLTFYNNIFEYINDAEGLDSVKSFLYNPKYYLYKINESESVLGGIDSLGRNYYSDSVMVRSNTLFYQKAYLGLLDSEDSTYWMAVPDNKEWDRMVTEYSPYFMYHKKIDNYDSLRWAKPRLAILEGTTFSTGYNPLLRQYGEGNTSVKIDSLMSFYAVPASYRKSYWGHDSLHYYQYGSEEHPQDPFTTGGVFENGEIVQCSNGYLVKQSKWNIAKNETFLRDIIVEAENAHVSFNKKNTDSKLFTYTLLENHPMYDKVSNHKYLRIKPYDESLTNPEVAFLIPNILSNVPYDIYMITVPECAEDTTKTEGIKINVSRLYKNLDGEGPTMEGIDTLLTDNISTKPEYTLGSYNGKTKGTGYGLDVDTICLGTNIVFPTCSYGEDPEVELRIIGNVNRRDKNTRTLRIDCIIFRQRLEPKGE